MAFKIICVALNPVAAFELIIQSAHFLAVSGSSNAFK
jgi:hypothetical protein